MSPTVEMATNPTQEAALERAAALPAGEATALGEGAVVAGPIYAAASGRRCRAMVFGSQRRLACEALRADGWVFVPNVFGEPRSAGAEAIEEGKAP